MNVFSISSNRSFSDVLATSLLEEYKEKQLELTDVLMLLPTRRACRTMRDAFVRHCGGQSLLLPRIIPIGDVEDQIESGSIYEYDTIDIELGDEILEIPNAISSLRRQLILARLIMAKPSDYGIEQPTYEQATKMAMELGILLDQIQTEGLDVAKLENIVPDKYASHWQEILKFLQIIINHWPKILKSENNLIDPAERRARLMKAQSKLWLLAKPKGKIIAAGSTGSQPTTADFLKTIASLGNGCVILPGLDTYLDNESWGKIDVSHPQFNMKNLLSYMGIERSNVKEWDKENTISNSNNERVHLISEVMRPSDSTEKWLSMDKIQEGTISNINKITCQNIHEEATCIAVILREMLETPSKTAALVTPDRELARRVSSQMKRWGINIDDSAGVPLHLSVVGTFLRLCIEVVSSDFAPYQLLALLKHPLMQCDLQVIDYIENKVFRGHNIIGLQAVKDFILRNEEEKTLENKQTQQTLDALDFMIYSSSKLHELFSKHVVELKDILIAHIEFAEAISFKDEKDELTLWGKDDGNSAAMFISDMIENSDVCGEIEPDAYVGILTALMSGIVVRPKYGSHPRISILGNMEARLLHTDLVIIGSANEGIWPSHASADAWMSRPMRKELGLPLPEKRVGLAAHDFAQAFCAPNVIITRSEKTAGTPSVPSRWLMRLDAVLELSELSLKESSTSDKNLSHNGLANMLDYAERSDILMPPAPCPPISARPREISVTQVEKWMRDPYSIYAKYILKLGKLEEIAPEIEAKDYGNIIHDTFEEFVKLYPQKIPEDGLEELLQIGTAKFDELDIEPEIYEFWQAKFTNIASWFIDTENARQPNVKKRNAEIWGNMTIPAEAGDFKIKAKADRIDEMQDGSLEIIDYKTGKIPSRKEVAAGYSPQLPLEAAIAKSGGFKDANGTDVEKISYWSLKGDGSDKASNAIDNKHDIDDIIDEAVNGVTTLINVFDRDEIPYEATPHPGKASEYSDYKHLSRQEEWSNED